MEIIFFILKIVCIVISGLAIVGNALVCHVIVRLKTMKTSINYIILNLAVLDAVTGFITTFHVFTGDSGGVFAEPVLQQAFNRSSYLADALCKAEVSYWLPVSISPLLLTIMAYERFKAIVHPLSRLDSAVTKARLKWMLPLAWVIGAACVLGYLPIQKYDETNRRCSYTIGADMVYEIVLDVSWLVISYIIPSSAMLVFYGRVICALKTRQDNALGPQAEAERARRKARKKVMWIVIVVTLVFYVCCGFPTVFYVVALYLRVNFKIMLYTDVALLLFAFNSAFNPLVYFTFIQSFRDGFRKIFIVTRRDPSNPVLEMNCPSQLSLGNENENVKEDKNGSKRV